MSGMVRAGVRMAPCACSNSVVTVFGLLRRGGRIGPGPSSTSIGTSGAKEWSNAGKKARVPARFQSANCRWNRERKPQMAQKKLPMRQIQEILRLKHQNQLSIREIARSCQLPVSTVWEYLKRAQSAGVGWPLSEALSEVELHQRLFGQHPTSQPNSPAARLGGYSSGVATPERNAPSAV